MSNRKQAFQTPQTNPSTKFIEWKSNDKNFSFYDKEKAEKVAINLPFNFLVLDELHTVKGWSDNLGGSIISNEVKFISKEPIRVKCYHKNVKGEKITTNLGVGLYKEIKEKIKAQGAHYVKSIYIMLEDGTLANLQLKGATVQKWGEFTQKTKSRLSDEWITVTSAVEDKKGSVKFYVPEFKFNKSLTDAEAKQADDVFNILEEYLKSYLTKVEDDAEIDAEIDF